MGMRGGQIAEAEPSQEKVINETLAVYRELLGDAVHCRESESIDPVRASSPSGYSGKVP